jgi:hypothetical protein
LFVNETNQLAAYSRDASTGCGGAPTTCAPAWTAPVSTPTLLGPPTVSGSTVIVDQARIGPSDPTQLLAFDATGSGPSCGGTPIVCQPLWTAPVWTIAPVTVANGLIYVSDYANQRLDVYDAAGQQGCAGSPAVCQPLWTSSAVGPLGAYESPAVSGGRVYLDGESGLSVFDAAGQQSCVGSPAVCSPLFTAPTSYPAVGGPSVSGGRVFVPTDQTFSGGGDARLLAFDAAGITGCSGTPAVCAPLWTAPVPDLDAGSRMETPVVANGRVYLPDNYRVSVYDAAGIKDCTSTPVVCSPEWSTPSTTYPWQPIVAGGVLYVGTGEAGVQAFDAAGVANCTAGTCSPLWTFGSGRYADSAPIVSDGWVFATNAVGTFPPTVDSTITIHAFRLPTAP